MIIYLHSARAAKLLLHCIHHQGFARSLARSVGKQLDALIHFPPPPTRPLYLSCPRLLLPLLPPSLSLSRARSQKFKAKGISSLKEERVGRRAARRRGREGGREGGKEGGERELLYANGLCEAMHRRRCHRRDEGPGGLRGAMTALHCRGRRGQSDVTVARTPRAAEGRMTV